MRRSAGVIVLAVAWCSGAHAFAPQFKPTLEVTKAAGPIRIDGELGDEGWRGAARALGFAEVQPGDQIAPPVESEAWVTYDQDHLYVALVAFDDPSAVRASLRERDIIFTDDYFGIMLDPYGDHSTGYEFFVNPLGIQGDLRMTSGGDNEDESFDAVWSSRGRVTDKGYQVEIAIPFSSLRFPARDEQVWSINFWRDHQREIRRRYAWAAIDRDDPCWMCSWGTLTGIRGIRPGSNVDVIASVLATEAGRLENAGADQERFHNHKPEAEASLNVRYGLTSDAAAEASINPDFSQIESDAEQIDVNETFALFYPERRPFFQDGSDLYDTQIDAIYTRSINNPIAAGKLTGRFGRMSLAYTVARDEDSPILIPLRERSLYLLGGQSTSQILRARRALGENSFAGFLATDRRLDHEGAGTVLSADAGAQLLENFRLEAQVAASRTVEAKDSTLSQDLEGMTFDDLRHTADLDGERYWGQACDVSFSRDGRVWGMELEGSSSSPTFRADNGFVPHNDRIDLNLWNGLSFQPNGRLLQEWNPGLSIGRLWTYDGAIRDGWVVPSAGVSLKYQTHASVSHTWSRERFSGRQFDGIRFTKLNVSSRPSARLSIGGDVSWGRRIARNEETPVLGRNLGVGGSATIRPTRQIGIDLSYDWVRMRHPVDDRTLFDTWVSRIRANCQLTRELSARVVLAYDDQEKGLDVEPLVTYRVNAFTVFYLGAGEHHLRAAGPDGSWSRTSRQFFAKFQYLVRT